MVVGISKGIYFKGGKMTYQKTTGSLMASGYQKLGTQEVMNDMYVIGGGGMVHRERSSTRSDCNGKRNMQDAELYARPNDNTSDDSETKNMNWDGTQISPTLTKNNANGGQRMPDKENFNAVIGKVNNARTQEGGDGMKDVSTVVRRLTPL